MGLEAVFVGDVIDGVSDTIRSYILELSPNSNGFVIRTGVDQLSLFLLGNSVAGFVSKNKRRFEKICCGFVSMKTYAKLYPPTPMLSLS